jgi:hypothetical protein
MEEISMAGLTRYYCSSRKCTIKATSRTIAIQHGTVALLKIKPLKSEFGGDLAGNLREILGNFPTSDTPKRFNV